MTRRTRIAFSATSVVAAALLLAVLPYIVGVTWSEIGGVLGKLSIGTMVWLVLLWLVGLWVYTYVMTASLPGLGHWQAFMLNAAGSSVSNILPFGGAAGVALTFAMCRSWGFRNGPVAVSTVVTGVWNFLVKLLLPVVGILALLYSGQVPDKRLGTAAVVGCSILVGIVVVLVMALSSERAAERLQDGLLRLAEKLPRRLVKPGRRMAGAVLWLRHTTIAVLRGGWLGLTAGMLAYVVLQFALFAAVLWATGVLGSGTGFGWPEAVAAFALNRILTTAVVTPAGTGISETGTAALLWHLGAAPAPASAAVLLYMLFTHTLEIPLGGAAGAWWAFSDRGRRAKRDQASPKTDFAHL